MPAFDAHAADAHAADAHAPQVLGPEAFSPEAVRRIAHDLNNALATVSGYAQLLQSQPDWPPHLARQLQTLAHDAERASSLANELLALARADQVVASAASAESAEAAESAASAESAESASTLLGGTPQPPADARSSGLGSAVARDASVSAGVGGCETGASILVVDDEEPVITLITEILSLDGHCITPAFNGAEALAWTQVQQFDLIISDVRMPAVGGPAFYEILQSQRPDLLGRVLFVTGDTVSLSTRHFLAGTQRPVLAKPFDPDRLRDMVARCLAS